ncbi:MAG: hypothetical protein HC852_05630 [Acaryochloridaceae cyanobacterium RU_4_10]|nr:hypothetical protein [Acaryochloridaceae cyanobacterium RU_4_10]
MSDVERNYQLKVLSTIVKKYLDESVPITIEGLNALEDRCNEVVWDLSTKIYSQSGHKIELSIVKDIVVSKIEALKNHLDTEKRRILKILH